MDKKLDQRLMDFNTRYQDIVQRSSKMNKIKIYTSNLRRGNFIGFIRDLKYRMYARKHFVQTGNYIDSKVKEQDIRGKKIAIYSCIIGRYDKINEPVYPEKEVDYFMFTDLEIPKDSIWKKIDVTNFPQYKEMSPFQMNRLIKFLPELFLPGYDYSIYIDGNIEPVASLTGFIVNMGGYSFGVHYHSSRDCIYEEKVAIEYYKKADMEIVSTQLNLYEKDGFPHHYGLFENSVLIRDHHDRDVSELMKLWWNEYLKYPTRDQLSLPYLIWKVNFPNDRIFILGRNLDRNPRFNRLTKHI